MPGLRGQTSRGQVAAAQPVIALMRQIGGEHGKTPSQVALNWLMRKGALPIPGAKNLRQMVENAGALGWSLTDAQVAQLDEITA
jgi:diketogulonate reductase-like aldo/keto reductase